MGGSRLDALGLPSNGLLLHPGCHDWVESHRKIAMMLGMILRADDSPAETPVMLARGWYYLNDDGTATRLTEPPSPPSVDAEILR